ETVSKTVVGLDDDGRMTPLAEARRHVREVARDDRINLLIERATAKAHLDIFTVAVAERHGRGKAILIDEDRIPVDEQILEAVDLMGSKQNPVPDIWLLGTVEE